MRDGQRWRPVLYQAHLSEVFVPYMGPVPRGWYFRTYMDSGEYGFGLSLSPLTAGVDCPGHATFLPALVNDDSGGPLEIPDAICIFERHIGDPAWRHFEAYAQGLERPPCRPRAGPPPELVVRTASVVGNYDYLIDYRFRQNGAMSIDIGSTGQDAVKGVASTSMEDATAAADTAHGTLVAPNLVAPFHDHYFNFRVDFDVDGPVNHPAVLELVAGEPPPDSPRRSFWTVERSAPASELEARYTPERDGAQVLPGRERGRAHGSRPSPRLHDPPRQRRLRPVRLRRRSANEAQRLHRARHLEHRPRPAQRYAGGEFPMQSDGSDTLAEWVKADRPLQGADVVTWFTAGFHHLPRAEDWPVMSTHWKTIHIVPYNFFTRNPALTIPAGH